jgi:hypothetical protein
VISILRRQADAIAADPALRAYGAALAGLQLLFAYWIQRDGKLRILAPGRDAICWPLLPECEWLRVLPVEGLEWLLTLHALAALAVGAAFLRRGWTGRAYAGLWVLLLVELAVLAIDFRLRRNQHSMALAVTGAFLAVPDKRAALRVLICLFYFWAGTLKLNWEWLSGAALYRPVWLFSGDWLIAATSYVIALELAIVWGLLARRAWLFWGVFAQLVVFHVFSWPVVGFFYPILMFLILAIFPLCWWLPGPARGRPRAAWALAAGFSALQLTPYLYPGDRALTGEGRLFALHMFDALVTCEAWATLELPDGRTQRMSLRRHWEARTACDPILIHGAARNLCRARDAGRRDFVDLDVELRSRRTSETGLTPVIALEDFCAHRPRYHPFRHNGWILGGEAHPGR